MKNIFANVRELYPVGLQESFYGKALIVSAKGEEILYSYLTPIIKRKQNGDLVRLWGGWSATTGRHIYSFCGLRKKDFDKMKVEK